MKTLKDHTIYYDEVCPLCNTYTSAFVRSGMLDEEGRQPYQKLGTGCTLPIDRKRAVDEIALLNKATGEVHYGINSLFFIIGHSYPFLKPLFRFRPFAWLMKKIYRFISYNRRVIIPSKDIGNEDQSPSLNARYRSFYLLFTWIITSIILFNYSRLITDFVPAGNFYREFMVCGGQIAWQLVFISFIQKKKTWDYLGNLMTISFAGGLLLLPALLISGFHFFEPVVFVIYFGLVVTLMLLEHIRRSSLLRIGGLLTFTWIVYRIILLLIIR